MARVFWAWQVAVVPEMCGLGPAAAEATHGHSAGKPAPTRQRVCRDQAVCANPHSCTWHSPHSQHRSTHNISNFVPMSSFMECAKIEGIGKMTHFRISSTLHRGLGPPTESLKLRSGPDARCSARCLARFGLALRHHRPSAVQSAPPGEQRMIVI